MFGKNPYRKTLPVNTQGRDFVVGDLHGCKALLDAELVRQDFDVARDRLFSVGDLVDRGPDSEGCLDLLMEPWFHAVMGNHDAMLMAWLREQQGLESVGWYPRRQRDYAGNFTYGKGWQWAKRYHRAADHLPLLESLPFILEVDGQFQVVHAETVDLYGSGEEAPQTMDAAACREAFHFILGYDGEGDWLDHLLWGRNIQIAVRAAVHSDAELAKLGKRMLQNAQERSFRRKALRRVQALPVYCGHTIVPEVACHAGHIFVDTGAYDTGNLTVLEIPLRHEPTANQRMNIES
ncbi:metallophosphoesterase [Acidithiobacillus sp. M4-SHS-6]|uniref:metallophosphoesterase n=1 Tax=Acidithiobacillus sp. M4-SHS-6 TaxID=3383024 RepID=UPI0039BE7FFE